MENNYYYYILFQAYIMSLLTFKLQEQHTVVYLWLTMHACMHILRMNEHYIVHVPLSFGAK